MNLLRSNSCILYIVHFISTVSTSSVLLNSSNKHQRLDYISNEPSSKDDIKSSLSGRNDDGGFFLDDIEAVTRADTLECPSSNVISTRYKCQVKDQWVDCYRRHCCHGYNFVAGRCLSETVDPCSHKFCEQRCSVYFGRVICTCFSGYAFSPENHKKGVGPVCLDINECEKDNGGCDQICINTEGKFSCKCRTGFQLLGDNRTCELISESGNILSVDGEANFGSNKDLNEVSLGQLDLTEDKIKWKSRKEKCVAPCSMVFDLENKLKELEEKVVALSTAVRLYSFAAGPPGPEGPSGPPGPIGNRGFPGPAGTHGKPGANGEPGIPGTSSKVSVDDGELTDEDFPMDSWAVVKNNAKRQFCRCRRGAVGPPGAPGRDGPIGFKGDVGLKGEQGEPGSLDFLLLMMADLKYDIKKIQDKVFTNGDLPEPFDFNTAMNHGTTDGTKFSSSSGISNFITEETDNRIYGAAIRYEDPVINIMEKQPLISEAEETFTSSPSTEITSNYESINLGIGIHEKLQKSNAEITNLDSKGRINDTSELENNNQTFPKDDRIPLIITTFDKVEEANSMRLDSELEDYDDYSSFIGFKLKGKDYSNNSFASNQQFQELENFDHDNELHNEADDASNKIYNNGKLNEETSSLKYDNNSMKVNLNSHSLKNPPKDTSDEFFPISQTGPHLHDYKIVRNEIDRREEEDDMNRIDEIYLGTKTHPSEDIAMITNKKMSANKKEIKAISEENQYKIGSKVKKESDHLRPYQLPSNAGNTTEVISNLKSDNSNTHNSSLSRTPKKKLLEILDSILKDIESQHFDSEFVKENGGGRNLTTKDSVAGNKS